LNPRELLQLGHAAQLDGGTVKFAGLYTAAVVIVGNFTFMISGAWLPFWEDAERCAVTHDPG
jgi:hypothetical protein